MDDMNLLDRFHAAFDVAPPAGGFERLRRELSRPSADRSGRPAFHVRHNKMTLRLTAAVAAVVVAIALVAAYLAAQRPTTSYVPASDKVYRSVIQADHDALLNSYSYTDCLKFTDPTCAPRIATVQAAVQKWAADLEATPAPPRFGAIDRELRLHLNATYAALTAASEEITAGNQRAFNTTLDALSGHQAPWFDRMANAILYSQTGSTADYKAMVDYQRLSLSSCSLCQEMGGGALSDCTDPLNSFCSSEVSAVGDQIAVLLSAAVQIAAPSELNAQGSRLLSDLADADKAILDMEIALWTGSPAGASALPSDQTSYHRILSAIDADITTILQS